MQRAADAAARAGDCSRGCRLATTPITAPALHGNITALHVSSLLAFFDRFPQFRGRPLYVAGHSYAGVWA